MSMLLHGTAWKAALAVLGASCLAIVGVAGASATTTTAAAPTVDHQLCYSATGVFKVPTGVYLINQFSPNGFAPQVIPKVALHCNPVIKAVPGAPIITKTNPNAHLACFPIAAGPQQPHVVLVGNQFGQAILMTGQPNLLCVPSWKGVNGPPMKKLNTPPGLSHFTCYTVSPLQGGYQPPAGIALRDQFALKRMPVQVNPLPQELCLPTEKIVHFGAPNLKDYPIIDPNTHLLCFQVTKTPRKTPVWDQNQFGTAKVKILGPALAPLESLCVPSTKQVLD